MNSLLVKRNLANLYRIGHVVFYPGITEIKDEDDIKMVQSHEAYKDLVKKGVMEEVSSKVPESGEPTADITEMAVKDALAVVRGTYAVQVLQDMHQRENDKKARKAVIQAITDQIAEIHKPTSKKKDQDEE